MLGKYEISFTDSGTLQPKLTWNKHQDAQITIIVSGYTSRFCVFQTFHSSIWLHTESI